MTGWFVLLSRCVLQLERRGEAVDRELVREVRRRLRRNGYGHAYLAKLRRRLRLAANGDDERREAA